MRRILLSLPFLMLPLLFALPALAGNWGEDWGTLTWGAAIAAVPSMGKLAVLVLVLALGGLAARFIQRGRAVASLLVIGLVVPMLAPVANAQTVSVPNTLSNGSLAEADAMNANFEAVRTGVNLALTSADVTGLTQFTNGTPANADEVNANFTAVVDGVNTALANRATDCAGAGGTWDAGTSTCTPAAAPYNCFVGGFCSQAAINFPPATFGYTNVYDGHTQNLEPGLGAGCNALPGAVDWSEGVVLFIEYPFQSGETLQYVESPIVVGLCASN
jgi:hypothetical protein